MAEYQTVVGGFLNEPLTGRRPIETPETEIDRANVLKVVMGKAEPIHLLNKNEIRFLHNYYLGSQPVLRRTKEYHAEITNRIVENHANECVGFYTGYMSGTPCSYVRSETATGDGEEIAACPMLCSMRERMRLIGGSGSGCWSAGRDTALFFQTRDTTATIRTKRPC